MSPERRRRVVPHLRRRFGVSERRACALVGQARSTQRRRRGTLPEEEHLRKRLRALATGHPRWGYRKQHALLCREGLRINRKRVRRLWREEGLQVRRPKRRRRKGAKAPGRQAASHPNHTWAMDYQFDETAGGRRLKILNVTDEFTREALASRVGRSIDAGATVKVLSELVRRRGAPAYVRCDNGPEFISDALKRWCLRSGARTLRHGGRSGDTERPDLGHSVCADLSEGASWIACPARLVALPVRAERAPEPVGDAERWGHRFGS